MAKFRKRPVVIDALQFTGGQESADAILEFAEGGPLLYNKGEDNITVMTPEGPMLAMPEDWIIRGVEGEYYPCKPTVFELTYEAAE